MKRQGRFLDQNFQQREASSSGSNKNNNNNARGEEDQWLLPPNKVVDIMRQVLPSHAQISEDALEAMQDCVCEFVTRVTVEANKKCRSEGRKTLSVNDLLLAMNDDLALNKYAELLAIYYDRYSLQNVATYMN
ncbi:transcriptional activator hap3-like [Arachis stenosperma]|uniref:transcriptional activator hap3-like n=1 Tax=Arachis stenosperma TaxID=217475 RepID=UPI0025AD1306|nr:transcriptional activator hap3-like [Arachis stenosperma]